MGASIIRFTAGGWRAREGEELTDDNVARLAGALGLFGADRFPGGRVLVGYDTRADGRHYALLASQIIASYGLEVALSERPCPLPALNWAASKDGGCIGSVMVSASEAPRDYNGIMAHRHDGGPIRTEDAAAISKLVSGDAFMDQGDVADIDVITPYLDDLARLVDAPAISGRAPLVVCDCLYGAAYGCLARALQSAGARVVAIHEQHRPDFGGLRPSCVEPWTDACERAVASEGAAAGIVVDGDGDRAAVIDERGHLISPHVMVPIIMRHIVKDRGLSGRIVATVASSQRIARSAWQLGLPLTTVPVGFSRIYDEMADDDVLLACEEYGGISIPAHLRERDGLLAGLLFIECMAQTGLAASELVRIFESKVGHMEYGRRTVRPDSAEVQTFRNILPGLNPPSICGEPPAYVSHADGLKMTMEDGSWLLVRTSRFGPAVRIYAEAPSSMRRDQLLDAGVALIEQGLA